MSCKYQILTQEGFKDFDGVRRTKKDKSLRVTVSSKSIVCTEEHLIKTPEGWNIAKNLQLGDQVRTSKGYESVTTIETLPGGYFFDPINVRDVHSYWASDFLNHNCSFLGTGDTYIEGEVLQQISKKTSENYYRKYNNRMRVWQDPEPHYTYLLACDTSLGRDRDYSAFHIINTYNGQQVAEFYSNRTPINEFAQIINNEGLLYNLAYVVCERNTIGNNLIDWLWNELEYENLWFDEKENIGFQVTSKNREVILAELEEAVRTNFIKINSSRTLDELFTFVIKENGRAEAEKNHHDDLVMSMALAVHVYKSLIDTTPMEFVSRSNKEDGPAMPSKNYKHTFKTAQGTISEEDFKWLMK